MRQRLASSGVLRLIWVVGVVAVLCFAAVAAVAKPGAGGGKDKSDSKTFVVEGTVDGFLYPSVDLLLPVKIENPFKRDIEVTSVTITVADASPACTAANVTVGDVPVPVLIEAGEDHVAEVPIVMPPDAANECQGAVFPISYEGVARKP